MTVNTTSSRVSYAGNGSTTAFAVNFYFLANADLTVIKTSSAGVETTLVLNTDYTVSGAGNPSGGTVTCTVAPTASESLVIFRAPAETQLTDYQANDPFPAETHERALDKLTMIAQRLKDLTSRSLTLSDGDTTTASTTLPSPEANKVIGWDNTAGSLVNVDSASLATIVGQAYTVVDKFTGTGAQTVFTLSQVVGSTNMVEITVSGVVQNPSVDYSIAGKTLTFSSAPANGLVVIARYIVAASQVPGTSFVSESYTATGGQTAFTTASAYQPGGNTLSVYVNGLRMTSVVDYAETSSNTVTFNSGLTAGDEVKFDIWAANTIGATNAANVTYSTSTPRSVASKLGETVSVLDFGAIGDGATDDTAAIQAAIDANKGKTILLPAGYSFYGAGVLLSGSTYNNTSIVVEGEFKLKPAPALNTSNFIACWSGIIFQDVSGCSIEGTLNGNRTNQQDKEQTYTLCLAGVQNFSIPYLYCKEIRGDGVYVSQRIINASSTNSDGLTIGEIHGYNSAVDGRNLLSIISCDNVNIGLIHSINIGGTVGGGVMPGGFDIEPDHTYQSCKNITVGTVNVVTAGASGLGIAGRAGTTVTQNVIIGSATVVNTCAPTVVDGAGNTTVTGNHTLVVGNANDVTIGNYLGKFTAAFGDAVIVTNSDRVTINGAVQKVREGARIGGDTSDSTGNGVRWSNINLNVDSTCRYGIRTGKITDCVISGTMTTPLTGYYAGSLFAVFSIGGFAQTRCTYSVSVPYSADWTRGYRNDNGSPCTYTDTKIYGADFTPGNSWSGYIIMKDMAVPIYSSVGYTDGSTRGIPTTGPHIAGTYVRNGAPAVGSPKGWYCTVSGTPGTWVSEGNL